MKLLRIVTAAAALIVSVTAATAQSKPDFSGQWVYVSPAVAAGQEQRITQTDTTLTTWHRSERDGHQATYRLDGTESRNVLESHGQEIVSISRAAWEGDRLVITRSTTYPDGRKLESKQVWSLDEQQRLVIESTETMAGRPPQSRRAVLTRKQQADTASQAALHQLVLLRMKRLFHKPDMAARAVVEERISRVLRSTPGIRIVEDEIGGQGCARQT